ncbi:MAG: ABC transporter permease [Planctomycetes bacterium]|nr:ABC transporter permease [Planctomycetota bacterium]
MMKKEVGIFVLLLALCAVVSIMDPRFVSAANLQNQARLIGMYGVFSIGMGVVIVTAGIDLSVGSIFALQGVLLSMMLREWHWPWPLAVAAVIGGTMALGTLHGALVTVARLQPFIVTLCGLLFYRGAARFIASDEAKGFGAEGFGMLRELATGSIAGVPMPFVALVAIAVLMWVVLHRSVYGRYLFAVGRNEDAARYSGINSRLIIASAYVVAAALAGISGILIAFYTNSISPSGHGTFYELYGIAAAVLGGCSLRGGEGSVIGIVIGTALLQVLRNLVNLLGIPSSLEFAVMGAVILAGVMVDQVLMQRRQSRLATKGPREPAGAPKRPGEC